MDVIFRVERSGPFKGDVTAVFPSECADYSGRHMTCYAHVGQHGSCGTDWYYTTRPAKPDQYAPLLVELRGIYETSVCDGDPIIPLRVVKRMTRQHRQEFEADLQRSLRSLRADPSGGPWSPAARDDAAAAARARGI